MSQTASSVNRLVMTTPRSPKPHIAILGAGPTGLEAALAAIDAGFPFTLYETRRGGRRAHPFLGSCPALLSLEPQCLAAHAPPSRRGRSRLSLRRELSHRFRAHRRPAGAARDAPRDRPSPTPRDSGLVDQPGGASQTRRDRHRCPAATGRFVYFSPVPMEPRALLMPEIVLDCTGNLPKSQLPG